MTATVVSIGETMAVLTSPETGRLRDTCSLGLTTAGAESNVAIGVRRLGHRTAWIGRLGRTSLARESWPTSAARASTSARR